MTTPTPTNDLVKRLEETVVLGLFDAPNPASFRECLDEIQRLTAERDAALAREAEKDSAIRELSAEVRLRRVQCGRMGMALSHIKEANNLDGARMTADIALIVASPENIPHDAEADTQSPSDRLGAWLSAALDDPQVCEEMKADIRAWFAYGKWPSASLRAQAEAEAFRAGAEAMRKAAAVAADEYGMTYEVTIGRDRGVRTVEYKDGANAIRALPIGAPT